MDRWKKIAGVFFCILAAVLIVWAVATVPVPNTIEVETKSDSRVIQYTGNTIREEKKGKDVWELTAESMDIDVDSQDALMKNIKGKVYLSDGRLVSITALSGKYTAKTKDVILAEEVHVATTDGATLTCKELSWSGSKDTLTAAGAAEIKRENVVATGECIESSDGFRVFRVKGNAHLTKGI